MTDKKQSMLHEILAVEADAQGTATKILAETAHTFREKGQHFTALHRTLSLLTGDEATNEALEKAEEQHLAMVSTVHEKLAYTLAQVMPFYDVVLQKEATNQEAKADLVTSNGTVIGKDLPATFLLGMEAKLKALRTIYEAVPTLPPGIKWEKDESQGKGIYKMSSPEVRTKTAKTFQHKVLVAPTDKHPAQIEKWEETITIGTYTKDAWSSALTPTEKSDLLARIDDLIQSTKQARQRANSTPVRKINIGAALTKFLQPTGL